MLVSPSLSEMDELQTSSILEVVRMPFGSDGGVQETIRLTVEVVAAAAKLSVHSAGSDGATSEG